MPSSETPMIFLVAKESDGSKFVESMGGLAGLTTLTHPSPAALVAACVRTPILEKFPQEEESLKVGV